MEKIMQSLIDNWTKGVDTYTHNGSTWLIFADSKKWVIELTDNKTLWYNYNFFKQIFSLTSLDVVENQHLITKWVEDNIINKELTYVTLFRDARDRKQQFEDTLENGVKKIRKAHMKTDWSVEDTIKNGVKETYLSDNSLSKGIEYTIQNGVRHSIATEYMPSKIKNVIDNGIKETNHVDVMKFFDNKMEDTLENGVRLTEYQIGDTFDEIDDIIENGVKRSIPRQYVGENIIDKVIDKGIIETKFANRYDYIGPIFKEGKIKEVIENGTKNPTD